MDPYAPVKGKCRFWREAVDIDDINDMSISKDARRVVCSCFVEGDHWTYTVSTVPSDCTEHLKCRYYVKST